ncbi:Predicted oxidoreductase [Atopostipes suicloacalis DSM 15692]|uniref:Predicted oxidoreductase n=1 Tax=Atopostipes suicloacalis DSM 15692 TaxID=1121025 RepID=A0A1M4S4W4_9LACT|nr:aldo/keto reductase [Atopostipes suicloacalis]SHE27254.1 Predicted oxidoreductase [Atopostipes suicloacalis DSM 15692]
MKYEKLGNTGLDVSKICLGCMSFGDPDIWMHDWLLDEEESRKTIKKALNVGINFFDTANIYSLGVSEEFLGRAMKDFANREEVVISTKVNGRMHEGPNGAGLSRKHILHEVEASLERLGMDYVDILYIHRWDYETPIEETMQALNDLVRSGKVHYIGASSMYTYQFQKAQQVAEINGWTKFVAMQNHYNLVYREEEREMNPYTKETGVALVPYSPLAAGRLAREWDTDSERMKTDKVAKMKYDSTEETDRKIIEEVGRVAKKHDATRAQIATAWLWEKGVVAPIVGITKEKYLDDFVGALDVKLDEEDIEALEKHYVPHAIMGHN